MIEKKEVKKISNLARINLSEEEISLMQKEISNILNYFKVLSELDVSNVSPFSFSYLDVNTTKEDIVIETKEDIKKSFPDRKGDYLKVKEIF